MELHKNILLKVSKVSTTLLLVVSAICGQISYAAKSPLISVLVGQISEPIWIYNGLEFSPNNAPIKIFKKYQNELLDSSEDNDLEETTDEAKFFYKFKKIAPFLHLDPAKTSTSGIYWIQPAPNSKITVQIGAQTFNTYRGDLQIRVLNTDSGKLLQIINILPLEHYLAGVVAAEMPSSWPLPALQAQAIVARTYALYQMLRNRQKTAPLPYDLVSTSQNQVYAGVKGETSRTTQVIMETRGKILTQQSELIEPFFFAHSGGQTEVPKNIWLGTKDYGYLTSHYSPECAENMPIGKNFCQGKAVQVYLDQALPKLESWFTEGQTIKSCSAIYPNFGSRLQAIDFVTSTNYHVVIPFKILRQLLGSSVFGTSLITQLSCDGKRQELNFKSLGSGHGVGMSQYGAYYLARFGEFDFEDILNYYYTNTMIVNLEEQFTHELSPQAGQASLLFRKKSQF